MRKRDKSDRRPVMIFAQDEARFGRITSVGKGWAPKGIRPCVKQQMVRQYTYAFTAACAQTGENCSLILPRVNTHAMQLFLNELSLCFPNYFIVMQVDQAKWHTSEKLSIPENIRLIHQPPGSPETNPIENLWDYLKENYFRNRFFRKMDDVEKELSRCLEKIRNSPELVQSIVGFPHLNIRYLNAN